MESGVVGQAKVVTKTQEPSSPLPAPIAESEYIKINGPFVTISSFTVMDWQDSNAKTIKDMTVKTLGEASDIVQKALYGHSAGELKIYFTGIEVTSLGDFCKHVVNTKGNALFTAMRG